MLLSLQIYIFLNLQIKIFLFNNEKYDNIFLLKLEIKIYLLNVNFNQLFRGELFEYMYIIMRY